MHSKLALSAQSSPAAPPKTDVFQVYLDEQSLSTVIERVAAGIAVKIPANVSAVQVSRFSYAGCNIYDKFAREFSVTLANKLSSLRPNVQFSTEGSQAQTYEIRGQYETRGDKLGIVAELYDPTGGIKLTLLASNHLRGRSALVAWARGLPVGS